MATRIVAKRTTRIGAEFPVGYRFGDFQILEVAGRGAMGVVYRARQLSLGRTVALKVVAQALVGDPGFRARFQREARAAAALSHPNIVSIHEARQLDGVLYIAMEWVDGGDLGHYLEKNGPMRPELAARVVTQIGDALDVAHAGGLLHRDVKPANILVRDMSARLHAYLTDFGVTRPFVELQSGSRDGLTKPGHIVGTPGFLSPEQIQDRKVDGRSDLYALGCVLFEALAGEPPFTGANFALMVAHTHSERPRVSDVNPKLGTAFDEIVDRAIAIEPDKRFPTGRALAEALEAAASASAPQAEPRFPPLSSPPPRSKLGILDEETPSGPSSARLVIDLDDSLAGRSGHKAPAPEQRPASARPHDGWRVRSGHDVDPAVRGAHAGAIRPGAPRPRERDHPAVRRTARARRRDRDPRPGRRHARANGLHADHADQHSAGTNHSA